MPHLSAKAMFGLSMLLLPLTQASAKPAGEPMGLPALQARAVQLGVQPTELELKGMIAEIEGADAKGRKVELTLDRRSGEVLNRKFDD